MPPDGEAARLWSEGQACLERGDLPLAAEAFAGASRQAPDWPDPAFHHCLLLVRLGDGQAGPLVQDLLARFPDYAAGWEDIGRTLLTSGKPAAALLCFRRAEAAAGSAAAALLMGLALRALGRASEAAEAFAIACRRDKGSARARFLLALCAQDARDWPKAAMGYRQALAIAPALAEAWVNLGSVLQEMGDVGEARQAYRAAFKARGDTLGRIAQAMTTAPHGELWLDLGRLRRDLAG